MDSQGHEYGRYPGSQRDPIDKVHHREQEQTYIDINSFEKNIAFLEKKFDKDLREAYLWNTITRGASIAGYALILIGVAIVFMLSISSGLGIGLVAGGLTSLSGIVFNIFTNLIANPSQIFNKQVQEDTRLLSEAYENIATITQREFEIELFQKSIARLPLEVQQNLLTKFTIKEFGLSEQG